MGKKNQIITVLLNHVGDLYSTIDDLQREICELKRNCSYSCVYSDSDIEQILEENKFLHEEIIRMHNENQSWDEMEEEDHYSESDVEIVCEEVPEIKDNKKKNKKDQEKAADDEKESMCVVDDAIELS